MVGECRHSVYKKKKKSEIYQLTPTMDNGLNEFLLQSLLDLRVEFLCKTDKLISALEQSTKPAQHHALPNSKMSEGSFKPHMIGGSKYSSNRASNNSMKSATMGIRWDPDDYGTVGEPIAPPAPHIFKEKAKGTNSLKVSMASMASIVGTSKSMSNGDFNAFRSKRGGFGGVKERKSALPHLETIESSSRAGSLASLTAPKGLIARIRAKPVLKFALSDYNMVIPDEKQSLQRKYPRAAFSNGEHAKKPSHSIQPRSLFMASHAVTHTYPAEEFKVANIFNNSEKSLKQQDNSTEVLTIDRINRERSLGKNNTDSSNSHVVTNLSISSLDGNVSVDSISSPKPDGIVDEVRSMISPKISLDVTTKDAPSPCLAPLEWPHELSISIAKGIETISRAAPHIHPSPIVQDKSSYFTDLFSYYFLIPAYDGKGRQIALDQFDKVDFDGMHFTINGLHPKSRFMTGLDLVLILSYLACLFLVPLVIGFDQMGYQSFQIIFSIIMTAIYSVDSLMMAVTPQSDVGKSSMYSIKEYEMARSFLKAWLWRWATTVLLGDVVSTIPFELFISSSLPIWRFFPVLRLLRISRLPSLLHRCAFTMRLKTYLDSKIGAAFAKIVPIGIGLLVYLHYTACAIYYSGQSEGFLGWSDLWMKITEASIAERYVWSFLLAVGNIFPLSFKPQSLAEQFAAIISIFIGAGLYAILVGYISSAAISIDNSGRVYNQKMEELVDYIKWKKLNDETKDKLIQYYETKYRGKYFEEDGLLTDMNEALRMEISLQNTRDLIMRLPLLRREMNDHRDEIFYSQIASCLHARYFIPGDCVIKQGEVGIDMFFILSGKVDILVDGNLKLSLYDGAYFGEVALITKTLRTATVQAKLPSVLYRLTLRTFTRSSENFQICWNGLTNLQRKEKAV
ncbi:hypothetical protein BDR26DRAFT_406038 [Obelidium mucronatum]|nr:hypothetical protein BDR26DRAFT_406038 [Obelidium mucronatum]